jgi:nucleolar pre-ribosomal-associated protein 2
LVKKKKVSEFGKLILRRTPTGERKKKLCGHEKTQQQWLQLNRFAYPVLRETLFLIFKFQSNNYTPVLSKLKALTESRASFEENLKQAEAIAGLTPLQSSETSYLSPWSSNNDENFSTSKSHARAEWVLKWLLEKMKASEKNKESLLLPNTWLLLDRLVRVVPLAKAAQLLSSNSILSIIKECLEEVIRRFDVTTTMNTSTFAINSAGSDSSTTLDHGSPSRKRKRSPVEPKPQQEAPSLSELCKIIYGPIRLLMTILDLSRNESQRDLVSKEHMKSVLRTGTIEAAQILACWLQCLFLFLTLRSANVGKSLDDGSSCTLLEPILKIWELRSLGNDDNLGSSAATFSQFCFVPAAKLYSMVTSGGKFNLIARTCLSICHCYMPHR